VKQALKKLKNSPKDVVAFPRMKRAANPVSVPTRPKPRIGAGRAGPLPSL
jgi:hypothetical protein